MFDHVCLNVLQFVGAQDETVVVVKVGSVIFCRFYTLFQILLMCMNTCKFNIYYCCLKQYHVSTWDNKLLNRATTSLLCKLEKPMLVFG